MAGGIWLCCSSIGYLSKLGYEQEHEQEQDVKSFITQRFNRIEARGEVRRNERGNRANKKCADTNDSDISRNHFRGNRRKLIDFARVNLDVQCRCEPVTELVAVTDQRHSKSYLRQ